MTFRPKPNPEDDLPRCVECEAPAFELRQVVPGGDQVVELCLACAELFDLPQEERVQKAARERSERKARETAEALAQLTKAGEWDGGNPPFGFRPATKTIERDGQSVRVRHLATCAYEQEITRTIRGLRRDGLSLREIAAELKERGYLPRGKSRWVPPESRPAKAWSPELVRRVIKRDEES